MTAVRRALTLVVAVLVLTVVVPAALADPPLPSADPFYSYSTADLSNVAPGTILRQRTIPNADLGTSTPVSATQVLFRTTGEQGQPTATVATIIQPATPAAVTRIVSYQTAYDALGSECDPSYTLQGGNSSYDSDEQTVIGGYVAAGYTVVDTDYEGTNLDWGAGQESGDNTLDGIRAAENLLNVPRGTTDGVMVAADDEALAHTYCQRGVSVQFNTYSGQDHDHAAIPFEAGALSFLTARLSGAPVPNGCGSIGTGNSLAPVPVPASPGGRTQPKPKLALHYLGAKPKLRGVAIQLWTSTGTLTKVTVRLRRAGKSLDTVRLSRVTAHKRRVVLRVKGKMPRGGHYAVVVARGGRTLARHPFRLR